jgi:hypothetical protein
LEIFAKFVPQDRVEVDLALLRGKKLVEFNVKIRKYQPIMTVRIKVRF